jgi:tRNA(Ile)-lysidine synthase
MRPERSSLFPSKHPAVRTVERSMAATGLPWRGRSVVLGVSGGADSTFLLHAINALRQRFGYAVVIAHVDHGWRGDESRADACAVSRSALGLGIPVHHLAVSVGAQARFDGGSEAAARAIRYAFFAEVAQACDAVAVLVAHTADDQAETIVLSLLRGRSMVGLSGMADVATLPVGKTSNAVLVRPMLSITAATVRETLRTYHVEWREDASNLDLSRARNRIRQEVMPAFEAISPGFRKALARAARELNAIRTIMDGAVSQACGRWELVDSAWRV